jgi:hypothetical protein
MEMMKCLLAKMDSYQEEMKAGQEQIMAIMKASQERMEAKVKAH